MPAYPVMFDVARPEKMGRAHVFLRILLVIVVSSIAGSGDGFGLIYLGLPVVAAILIAQKNGDCYLSEHGETLTKVLAFIVGLLAYVALLTDELPGFGRQNITFEITRAGSPTVGSALWRIVKVIPSAFVLALIGIVSWFVWIIAAVSILLGERYPEGLWNFHRGVIRWQARLLGYLASLVEPYPPFSLETGPAAATS